MSTATLERPRIARSRKGPAIEAFLIKTKMVDDGQKGGGKIPVLIAPNYKIRTTDQNTGIEYPEGGRSRDGQITGWFDHEFVKGRFDPRDFAHLGEHVPQILFARLLKHERYGSWFDVESVVMRDESRNLRAASALIELADVSASLVNRGVPMNQVTEALEGITLLVDQGVSIEQVLAQIAERSVVLEETEKARAGKKG